jgi:hypothetical protein
MAMRNLFIYLSKWYNNHWIRVKYIKGKENNHFFLNMIGVIICFELIMKRYFYLTF